MLINQYLKRIDVNSTIKADFGTLKLIQKQHLLTVPFENLDIHLKKPIKTDFDSLFEKIVNQRRGGICYELNGLLYYLLKKIGFKVKIVGARVEKEGTYFDHMFLVVTIGYEKYLVDVGYGDNFFEPLLFREDYVQKDNKGLFKIVKIDETHYELRKFSKKSNNYEVEYMFRNMGQTIENFQERMDYYVHSNHSRFKKNIFCSLEMKAGRISLKQDKFIVTLENNRTIQEVTSKSQFINLLEKQFKIYLNSGQIEKLKEWWNINREIS